MKDASSEGCLLYPRSGGTTSCRSSVSWTQSTRDAACHHVNTAVFLAKRSDMPPMSSGSLLPSLGLATQRPMLPLAQDFNGMELPGTFPFCSKATVTSSAGCRRREVAVSLQHPEDTAWKCPWSVVGALASGKRHHEVSPAFSCQAKV